MRVRPARPLAFAALLLALAVPPLEVAYRGTQALNGGRLLTLATIPGKALDSFAILPYGRALAIAYLDGIEASSSLATEGCDLSGPETCRIPEVSIHVLLDAGPDGIHRFAGLSLERPPAMVPFVTGTLSHASLVGAGASSGGVPCDHAACLTGRIAFGFERRIVDVSGLPGFTDDELASIRVLVRADPDGVPTLDAIRIGSRTIVRSERLW